MEEPFGILLELVREQRLDPWEVEVGRLIRLWLENLGETDLRLCGSGILSASTLLRIKSGDFDGNGGTRLLEEEEIPELPDLGPLAVVRFAPRKIQLQELLAAFAEAMRETGIQRFRVGRKPRAQEERILLNEFERNIEKLMSSLYRRLVQLGKTKFSELLEEKNRLAAVRLFLLLLFLAFENKISLKQEGHEIEVEVKRDGG